MHNGQIWEARAAFAVSDMLLKKYHSFPNSVLPSLIIPTLLSSAQNRFLFWSRLLWYMAAYSESRACELVSSALMLTWN